MLTVSLTPYKNALRSKILSTALALTTFTLGTAHAQDWIGPTPMDYANMNMSYTNTLINNAMIERMTRGNSTKKNAATNKKTTRNNSTGAKRSSGATTKNTPKVSVSPASFSYSVTAAQRTAYRNAYISDLGKSNRTLAASLRTQFQKHDYNTIYNGLLSGTGLTSNNLSDAFTAYTVLGWMIVNGQTSDPAQSSIVGARNQWANALAGTSFAKSEDSRRQTAEELKIKTVLLHAGWQDAQNIKQSAQYANAIDKLFQSQFKLKLRSLKLGSEGFKK